MCNTSCTTPSVVTLLEFAEPLSEWRRNRGGGTESAWDEDLVRGGEG